MILDVISFDTGTMSLTAYKERYVIKVESLLEITCLNIYFTSNNTKILKTLMKNVS